MTHPPVLFVHGYSSGLGAFDAWRRVLGGRGRDPARLIDAPDDYLDFVHLPPGARRGHVLDGVRMHVHS